MSEARIIQPMNNWQTFLQQQGANFSSETTCSFEETIADYPTLQQRVLLVPLVHLGLVSVNGEKGKEFLQGQTTCDFNELTPEHPVAGAQCNPKGRMLNSFRAIARSEEQVLLSISADLVGTTLADLGKFAPFFKAQLEDASAQFVQLGVIAPQEEALHQAIAETINSLEQVLIIKINNNCWQLITPIEQSETVWQQLSEQATPVGTALWQLAMIQSGLGQVVSSTREMFIPQMLNLQAVDAVSFKKGCYTGQEVVARMKYLGKLKRRMYRIAFETDSIPAAGTTCKLTADGQSIGNIVNAAMIAENQLEALAVLTGDAATADQLIIGGQPPTTFNVHDLPYSLEET